MLQFVPVASPRTVIPPSAPIAASSYANAVKLLRLTASACIELRAACALAPGDPRIHALLVSAKDHAVAALAAMMEQDQGIVLLTPADAADLTPTIQRALNERPGQ